MTIYEKAVAAGVEVDSHESDLYLPVTEETALLVKEHRAEGRTATTFVSQLDGKLWFDIPFAYDPWWSARMNRPTAA